MGSLFYSYKAPKSRNGLTIEVNEVNEEDKKEHLNSVLDILLKSCLNNDNFHNLLADTEINQRYN